MRTERALPPSITGTIAADSLYSIAVVSRDSTPLFASPVRYTSPYPRQGGRRLARGTAELLKDVWGYRSTIESRTVDTHIAKVRSKIDRGPQSHIVTVRKKGYRLR